MSGYAFDTNIIIDLLLGHEQARDELRRAADRSGQLWISRIVWIEVMSKGHGESLRRAEQLLTNFIIEDVDDEIAQRAAFLRRERSKLKLADAIILATALSRGRVLVTRNTRDFPAQMPGIRVPYLL